jgi:hypothetical protein
VDGDVCEQLGIGATTVTAAVRGRRVIVVRWSPLSGGKWRDKCWHLVGGAQEHVMI